MPLTAEQWNARRSGWPNKSPRGSDYRPIEERDRSRIIHCAAFRRLQGKTQVLGISEGDFHRTRLTHSMEVAQIARGIVLQLKNNRDIDEDVKEPLPEVPVIEAICYAHDLGHPPFGHRGELALDYLMRDRRGFEANAETLRIISRLELHTTHPPDGQLPPLETIGFGLDPTRRVLLGVLKYPAPYSTVRMPPACVPCSIRQLNPGNWKPAKCYPDAEQHVVDWIMEPFSDQDRDEFTKVEQRAQQPGKPVYKSLDAWIMDLADEIAYSFHDFEDAVTLELIRLEHWSDEVNMGTVENRERASAKSCCKALCGGGQDSATPFL